MWFDGTFIKVKRLDNPECVIGNTHAVLAVLAQRDEVDGYLGLYGKTIGGFHFRVEGCPEIQGATVYLRGRLKNWDGSPLIVEKEKLDELRAAFAELDAAVARSLTKDGETVEIDGRTYKLSLVA